MDCIVIRSTHCVYLPTYIRTIPAKYAYKIRSLQRTCFHEARTQITDSSINLTDNRDELNTSSRMSKQMEEEKINHFDNETFFIQLSVKAYNYNETNASTCIICLHPCTSSTKNLQLEQNDFRERAFLLKQKQNTSRQEFWYI